MDAVKTLEELESIYDATVPGAITKVSTRITPLYQQWIDASRFLILSTIGPEGTDASPRGDDGPVVQVVDDKTIWLPDWRGNNRLDSLRNIVRDSRVSFMFMVPGCRNVVRANGSAILTADVNATSQFMRNGKRPRTVIVFSVGEVYYQCAKALMRSGLWIADDESDRVPTAGQFNKEFISDLDVTAYDEGYDEYAKERMW
ncbi:MAG: pyridoxamine 5'-phosphate oxidase family protein [Pseudomonadales bacterium]|nr:pyridoxamine 5'-phosphate oxidase family protein [Pseudomonadales bacterium]